MKKYFFIFLVIGFYSCVKDKPNSTPKSAVQLSSAKKVYVINEGNFMGGNASVSLYDAGTGNVVEDLFKEQNNANLGDVAQSMCYLNSAFYVVVNNSGKIVACDNNFKVTQTISGLQSPRYILPVTNSKAYVSDLYANKIHILNLNSNAITSSIPFPGWSEQMVMIYNKVFVTNIKKNYLYIINAINDTKTDSVEVGLNTGNIVMDKNDGIWALSSGDKQNNIAPALKLIDPLTNQVSKTFTFPLNDYPNNLCLNKTRDTLYYLNNGICRLAISESSLPQTPFIAKGNKDFYGLGINPHTFEIYAADVLGFSQKANIYIYDANGNQKTFFKANIGANSFYFE